MVTSQFFASLPLRRPRENDLQLLHILWSHTKTQVVYTAYTPLQIAAWYEPCPIHLYMPDSIHLLMFVEVHGDITFGPMTQGKYHHTKPPHKHSVYQAYRNTTWPWFIYIFRARPREG